MNWEAIGATGEVIGALAVVATLFYLAFQVRQNSAVIRSNSAWDAQISFASVNEIMAQGGEIGLASFKNFSAAESLTPYEAYLVHRLVRATLQRLEAQFALYQQGILDPEVWSNRRRFARALTQTGLGPQIWELEKHNCMFTRAFLEEIESTEAPQLAGMLGVNVSVGAAGTSPAGADP